MHMGHFLQNSELPALGVMAGSLHSDPAYRNTQEEHICTVHLLYRKTQWEARFKPLLSELSRMDLRPGWLASLLSYLLSNEPDCLL